MEELQQLKQTLRSLVVSSPTQVDVRTLLRDFRSMMGVPLPASKYGYRDPLLFLRERFSDCFLGPPSNPTLTLIVPDTLKHIDKFVQSQKMSSNNKFKGKRRSVPDSILGDPPPRLMPNLDTLHAKKDIYRALSINTPEPPREVVKAVVPNVQTCRELPKETVKPAPKIVQPPEVKPSENKENVKQSDGNCSRLNLENFLRKRTAMYSSQLLDSETYKDDGSGKHTSDSGRQTSSSSSSSKRMQLEQLKEEVKQLVLERPEGVWCMQLMKLYREQYHRELNFLRFGYTSVVSFVCSLEPAVAVSEPTESGDCLLRDARVPEPRARVPVRRLAAPRARARPASAAAPVDPEDALPGIDFDPDVFPADCMHFMESIAGEPLDELQPGAMLEVMVGEVYSPSHVWLMRLGERHNIAMEDMMDEMTAYYNKGEGQNRSLARGAVRVGHYCSSVYENDWHRSLIVKIIDSDTVKVRHVDYGTVDTVSARALRPLLRRWAALPAQALRARLAAVRPPAAGRRWPRPAACALLRLVRDKRLVANVAAVDTEEDIIEVFLIDTSTDKDICIGTELVREGHADPRADSALRTSECYLYPRFHALESGATPNYAEIHAFLRDGIALDYVDDYRQHVPVEAYRPPPTPSSDPSPSPSTSPSPSPPPTPPPPPAPRLELVNRVPLFPSRTESSECAASDAATEEPCSSSSSSPPPPPTPPPPVAAPGPPRPVAAPRPPPAPPRPPPPQMMMPNYIAQPYPSSMQSLYYPMYPPYGPPPPQFYQMPRPPMQYPAGPPMQIQPPGLPMQFQPPQMQYPPRGPPGFNVNPGLRSAWRPLTPPGQHHPPPTPPVQHQAPPAQTPRLPYQSPNKPVEPSVRETKTPPRHRTPPPPYNGTSGSASANVRGTEADAGGRGADTGGRGGESRRVSTAHGDVTLTASECEIFSLLSRVDPNAAHWYMVDAIGRRMTTSTTTVTSTVASTLNPHAAEFRQVAATQTEVGAGTDSLQPTVRLFMESLRSTPRPPPGFD